MTNRIFLHHMKMEYAEDIFEYSKTEKVGPMAGWQPHTSLEETKEIVKKWLRPEPWRIEPSDSEYVWAIEYVPDKKIIGTFGAYLGEKPKATTNPVVKELMLKGLRIAEFGIVISEDYWGRGIATEVLKNQIDYFLGDDIVDVVVACCYDANLGSAKIQEKSGLKVVGGFKRDKPWCDTECRTMTVRALTREEWLKENK